MADNADNTGGRLEAPSDHDGSEAANQPAPGAKLVDVEAASSQGQIDTVTNTIVMCTNCQSANQDPGPAADLRWFRCGRCGYGALVRVAVPVEHKAASEKIVVGAGVGAVMGAAVGGPLGAFVGGLLGAFAGARS